MRKVAYYVGMLIADIVVVFIYFPIGKALLSLAIDQIQGLEGLVVAALYIGIFYIFAMIWGVCAIIPYLQALIVLGLRKNIGS